MSEEVSNVWKALLDQQYGGLELSDANRQFCDLMKPVSKISDTRIYDDEVGSFFLFSTIASSDMPSYSTNDCYAKKVSFRGKSYGCMYAGFDSISVGEAIRQHLLSDRTILNWRNGSLPNRPGRLQEIGRIPLDGIDAQEWTILTSGPSKTIRVSKVDYYKQAQDFVVKPHHFSGFLRMANGIHIDEPQWLSHSFSVIVLSLPKAICKLGRQINRDFERVNLRPPLNKQSL